MTKETRDLQRDARRQIERERITTIALEMIRTEGLLKFSVIDLMKRTGKSKPSFYYYFKDPKDVLTECYKRLLAKETAYLKHSPISLSESDLPLIRDIQAFIGGSFECKELDTFIEWANVNATTNYLRTLLPGGFW